jgi:hypothetical protein
MMANSTIVNHAGHQRFNAFPLLHSRKQISRHHGVCAPAIFQLRAPGNPAVPLAAASGNDRALLRPSTISGNTLLIWRIETSS